MAAPKASTPSVYAKFNAAGDLVLGAVVEGVFIPFATKHGAHVARIIEKAKAQGAQSEPESEGGE